MTLGWAIISTGLHVDNKIAPAITATPEAELVAIYSRDQGRAEACAQKHGAKAAYSDMRALSRYIGGLRPLARAAARTSGLPLSATPRSAATSRACCRSYCSSRRAATGSGAEKSRLKILSAWPRRG